MKCGHHLAQRVLDLEPVWVEGDAYSQVDIYFCEECNADFACLAGTGRIISPLSMRTDSHDEGSESAYEV